MAPAKWLRRKKNQKTFCPLDSVGWRRAGTSVDAAEEKVFLLLFVHKKKTLAFSYRLPSLFGFCKRKGYFIRSPE
jgi:hypothetical protein